MGAGSDARTNRTGEALRFWNLFHASHLVTPADFQRLRDQIGAERDAGKIAQRLIKSGRLTRWQAEQLLAGRCAFFFGQYKIVDRLGAGAAAQVYKAEHISLGRPAALKILKLELVNDPESVARFYREVRMLARLKHPNVVTAYDAGQVGNRHYLVMEHVEGRHLRELVDDLGPFPIDTACACIRQAALGLQHLHEAGLVHRDIKPSNLIVARGNWQDAPVVRIVDFGLVRRTASQRMGSSGDLTKAGDVLGTIDYAAPEQLDDPMSADIRADIYGLGATLFLLLTGELPYVGPSAIERLNARLLGKRRTLRDLQPGAPAALESVINRMLASEPEARFATPIEAADALEPFIVESVTDDSILDETTSGSSGSLQGLLRQSLQPTLEAFAEPLEAPTTTPSQEESIWFFATTSSHPEAVHAEPLVSRRSLLIASAVAVLLLCASLFWSARPGRKVTVAWPETDRAGASLTMNGKPIELPAEGPIEAEPPTGAVRFRASRPGYAVVEWILESGQSAGTFEPHWQPLPDTIRTQLLAKLIERTEAFETMPNDLAPLLQLRAELTAFIVKAPETPESIRALELLQELPSALDRWKVRSLGMGDEEKETPIVGAINASNDPTAGDPADPDPLALPQLRKPRIADFSFSPDGRWLAIGAGDSLAAIDLARLESPRLWWFNLESIQKIEFNPNGEQIAVLRSDSFVELLSLSTSNPVASFIGASPVVFSPTGLEVSCLAPGGRSAYSIRTTDGSRIKTWPAESKPWQGLCYSADGSSVALLRHRSLAFQSTTKDDPGLAIMLAAKEQPPIAISPDGRTFIITEGSILRVKDYPSLQPRATWVGKGSYHDTVFAFSADGKRIATTGHSRWVMISDIHSGIIANSLHVPNRPIKIRFNSDGRHLGCLLLDGSFVLARLPATLRIPDPNDKE